MKKVLRCLALMLIAVIVAGAILAFVYPGPKEALIFKGQLVGLGYLDSTALNVMEFGWAYGMIHARYWGKPTVKWQYPLVNRNGMVTFPVEFVFNCEADQEAFLVADRKKGNRKDGVKAVVWKNPDGKPLVVLERPNGAKPGKLMETWRSPLFKFEIIRLLGNRGHSV